MPEIEFLIVGKLSVNQIARIFNKIKVDQASGCWLWTGSLSGKDASRGRGYASVGYNGRIERVHRLLYAWAVGPIPRGCAKNIPVLDHVICNTPRCVNPVHLEPKTHRVNIMRGDGACASNARKTHCPQGHPLPEKADPRYGRARRCPTCLYDKRHLQERLQRKVEYDRQYRARRNID